MKLFGALAVLLTVAGLSHGSGCGVAVQTHQVYHAQHVQPVLAATYVAVPLVVPAYSVSYAPQQDATRQEVEKLRLEMEILELKRRVEQLRQGTPEALPLKQEAKGPPAPQSCASCHDSANAAKKGGDLVLFKEGVFSGDAKLALQAVEAVVKGRMPRGGKLTAEQTGDVIGFFAAAHKR